MQEVLKARLRPKCIECWLDANLRHMYLAFFVSLLECLQRLFLLSESSIQNRQAVAGRVSFWGIVASLGKFQQLFPITPPSARCVRFAQRLLQLYDASGILARQNSRPRLFGDGLIEFSALSVQVRQALVIDREAREHLRGLLKMGQRIVVAACPNVGTPEEGLNSRGERVELDGLLHFGDGLVVPAEGGQIAVRIRQMRVRIAGIKLQRQLKFALGEIGRAHV